jgi:uncharacterized protein YbjT (DUF2867 family)
MYTITGATGNIGKVIAQILLEKGQKVRAIGRNVNRLKTLEKQGAETLTGSLDDSAFLARAFDGATAVFLMIPPDFQSENYRKYQDRISEAFISALKKAGVRYVVNLSSLGANVPKGTGPIEGLYALEQQLNQLEGTNVLHLRPTWFMENFLADIPLIKSMGILGSPMKGDLQLAMIATRDIGVAAADRLLKLDFTGKSVQELLGQRDLTMKEAARILGTAIGKPDLPYVQFTYEDAEKGMMQAGLPPDIAKSYVEMVRALNEGVIHFVPRTPKNTTPTSIEEFAGIFAAAYKS